MFQKREVQIKMNYNSTRHFELLKRYQDLKKQGKHLYFENEKEYLELCEYKAALQEHVFWKHRRQFALLMENFINGIIDGEKFSDNFSVLYRKTLDAHNGLKIDFERLKDFQPDVRSKGFGGLISFLRAECDNFEEDYDNDEFFDSIKEIWFKLQEALDKELDSFE